MDTKTIATEVIETVSEKYFDTIHCAPTMEAQKYALEVAISEALVLYMEYRLKAA